MKKIIFLLVMLLPLPLSSAPGDYCLGNWNVNANTFCQTLMTYVQSIAVDRKVNRHIEAVKSEIHTASELYNVKEELLHHYINYIYAHEPKDINPNFITAQLFGGCIDNHKTIVKHVDIANQE